VVASSLCLIISESTRMGTSTPSQDARSKQSAWVLLNQGL